MAAYRGSGEAGLAGARALRGRGTAVDPRWDEAVRLVLAELVSDVDADPVGGAAARPARGWMSCTARAPCRGRRPRPLTGGWPGWPGAPTRCPAARRAAGRSRTGRRASYGRLRAMRPGEYVILDTQDLDVFAMEPVTCRWVRAQLTVAQDLFTRCITGLRVTPVSTKAVDVAGVLYQAVAAAARAGGLAGGGVLAVSRGAAAAGVHRGRGGCPGCRSCPPETLVIDHGKAFLSAHVISVCTRLGISIQPAQPKKPTDKPTCERFFKTLREGLIQHLPAYKGPDIYSRGEHVEDAAFLFTHELEDVIREWVALVYHRSRQDGLAVPEWPHLSCPRTRCMRPAWPGPGCCASRPRRNWPTSSSRCTRAPSSITAWRWAGCAMTARRWMPTATPRVRTAARQAGKWPVRINPDDVR